MPLHDCPERNLYPEAPGCPRICRFKYRCQVDDEGICLLTEDNADRREAEAEDAMDARREFEREFPR
jgi:hypothetical protein